jgi:hypothetical protein
MVSLEANISGAMDISSLFKGEPRLFYASSLQIVRPVPKTLVALRMMEDIIEIKTAN